MRDTLLRARNVRSSPVTHYKGSMCRVEDGGREHGRKAQEQENGTQQEAFSGYAGLVTVF